MEKLYTVKQLAETWDLSTRTIGRFISDGRLAHYKIGNTVKFSEKHIIQFLEANEY